ncbi:uncharacterized protein [Rutidosis leptorrhynchoides]|uniref:uncharacterized protein n=1 Tax=Rutidosis leptorrhynchoides TaxID=125765 RepID=UPI003A9903C9
MALRSKVKFNFVNGRIKQPQEDDANFSNWDRCNITTQAIWKDLQARFFKTDFSRISDVHEEIFTLKQGDLNISDYYTKMRVLWDEFDDLRPILECECAIKYECKALKVIADYYENDKIIRFLKGLNPVYAQTRSTIMMLDPIPSLQKVYGTISQYERHNILPQVANEPSIAAFSSAKGTKQNQNNKKNPKAKLICNHCGKKSHIEAECYRIVGFPPDFKFTRNASANLYAATELEVTKNNNHDISQDEYESLKRQAKSNSQSQISTSNMANTTHAFSGNHKKKTVFGYWT